MEGEYAPCDVYRIPWFTFGVVSLINLLVVESKNLPCDCIIGRDVLSYCRHSIDPIANEMEIEILNNKSFQVTLYKSKEDLDAKIQTPFIKYDNISIYANELDNQPMQD